MCGEQGSLRYGKTSPVAFHSSRIVGISMLLRDISVQPVSRRIIKVDSTISRHLLRNISRFLFDQRHTIQIDFSHVPHDTVPANDFPFPVKQSLAFPFDRPSSPRFPSFRESLKAFDCHTESIPNSFFLL